VSTEISDSPGESKIGAPSVFVRARCNGSEDHRNSLQEPPHALCCNGCKKTKKKKGAHCGPESGTSPCVINRGSEEQVHRERRASAAGAKSNHRGSEEQSQRGRRASAAGANIKRSGSEEQAQRWCADALVSRRGGRRTHRLCAAVAHRRRPANARRARRANAPREPSQRTAGAERTRRGSRANAMQRRVDLQTSQRFDKSARRPTDSHGSDGCGSDCDGDAGGGG
jgi:hypothetical protein